MGSSFDSPKIYFFELQAPAVNIHDDGRRLVEEPLLRWKQLDFNLPQLRYRRSRPLPFLVIQQVINLQKPPPRLIWASENFKNQLSIKVFKVPPYLLFQFFREDDFLFDDIINFDTIYTGIIELFIVDQKGENEVMCDSVVRISTPGNLCDLTNIIVELQYNKIAFAPRTCFCNHIGVVEIP